VLKGHHPVDGVLVVVVAAGSLWLNTTTLGLVDHQIEHKWGSLYRGQ
jgi:hypothetical protein